MITTNTLLFIHIAGETEYKPQSACDSAPSSEPTVPRTSVVSMHHHSSDAIIAGSFVGSSIILLLAVSVVLLAVLIIRQTQSQKIYSLRKNDTRARSINFTNPVYDGNRIL